MRERRRYLQGLLRSMVIMDIAMPAVVGILIIRHMLVNYATSDMKALVVYLCVAAAYAILKTWHFKNYASYCCFQLRDSDMCQALQEQEQQEREKK
jgi:hypothetical protein